MAAVSTSRTGSPSRSATTSSMRSFPVYTAPCTRTSFTSKIGEATTAMAPTASSRTSTAAPIQMRRRRPSERRTAIRRARIRGSTDDEVRVGAASTTAPSSRSAMTIVERSSALSPVWTARKRSSFSSSRYTVSGWPSSAMTIVRRGASAAGSPGAAPAGPAGGAGSGSGSAATSGDSSCSSGSGSSRRSSSGSASSASSGRCRASGSAGVRPSRRSIDGSSKSYSTAGSGSANAAESSSRTASGTWPSSPGRGARGSLTTPPPAVPLPACRRSPPGGSRCAAGCPWPGARQRARAPSPHERRQPSRRRRPG